MPLQGRDADDPALLDALLAVPLTHLLVDGYNVTKSGYGEVSLEAQRGRLLSGLGALAARTGAEVTVVFDGAERLTPVALAAPAGCPAAVQPRGGDGRRGPAAPGPARARGPTGARGVERPRGGATARPGPGAGAVPSRALLRLLTRG